MQLLLFSYCRRGGGCELSMQREALSLCRLKVACRAVARGGRSGEWAQEFQSAFNKAAFQLKALAVAELLRVGVNVRGQLARPLGVRDRLEQEVDESLVCTEGEHLIGVALINVHLSLVLEQLGVESERIEVLKPLALHVGPHKLDFGMRAIGLFELLLEGAERALVRRALALSARWQRV